MKPFSAIYYPEAECQNLTLAKAILVFDELIFLDHTSITLGNVGTVGHESHMRHRAVPLLRSEGYNVQVLEPLGGHIHGDLEKMIDADLSNQKFRTTFFNLLHNDPTFLMDKIHDGKYGVYGTAEQYRARLLELSLSAIPSSVKEISNFKPTPETEMPPEINIATTMALDSFNLNIAALHALDIDAELFGDSRGMDMMLHAKFTGKKGLSNANRGITNAVAYTLLERLVPIGVFKNKTLDDVLHFRNETQVERDRFKEYVLQFTTELVGLKGVERREVIDKLVYSQLLPEAREFQNRITKNRDTLFKSSIKAVTHDAEKIAQEVANLMPLSASTALLAGAARLVLAVVPSLVDFVEEKRELQRTNPYAYLLAFK